MNKKPNAMKMRASTRPTKRAMSGVAKPIGIARIKISNPLSVAVKSSELLHELRQRIRRTEDRSADEQRQDEAAPNGAVAKRAQVDQRLLRAQFPPDERR